ncbi:hypothetical protein AAZX31_14G122800 [Glycine max]|uniref:Uncharacterized protein n=2 Tax=Glycine subgen. Soja TaxID=1462606 RepID=K7M6L1_SOYBN|nr:hypothetical protein JHK87_039702 [Glycine soja]KAH1094357.1 hypothetical protein GYH30_039872 [Glycine max]KRH16142.1 hypothetical protein GLYMA_14G135200v4 [Glycine max]RZB41221.1 hypothetical protein D0Y65_055406 [Glycine soja]
MHQLFTFSKLKPLFSESIRLIHHITTKPSLAFTTQTLEANIFQERVRAEVVECGCVIELPELKVFIQLFL